MAALQAALSMDRIGTRDGAGTLHPGASFPISLSPSLAVSSSARQFNTQSRPWPSAPSTSVFYFDELEDPRPLSRTPDPWTVNGYLGCDVEHGALPHLNKKSLPPIGSCPCVPGPAKESGGTNQMEPRISKKLRILAKLFTGLAFARHSPNDWNKTLYELGLSLVQETTDHICHHFKQATQGYQLRKGWASWTSRSYFCHFSVSASG
ncbi:hypothetical protein B0T09DRAFT_370522 [Sordaria sp. MPI-SDFR-AT-0083]|nr:hypothetical protein B0T09DRAFT_370522 [Sordaria sp. MPI-SDFR-AT-0083]